MPGITPTGFEGLTLEQIEANLAALQRGEIDAGLDTSPLSLVGQFNGIFASKLAELWERLQQVYDAHDPAKAEDASLDAVCALTGTTRLAAKKSTVALTLSLEEGTTVPAGSIVSVDGNAAARFVLLHEVHSDDDLIPDWPGLAEAETAGPVVANAGTLTVIETPVSGWTSVTNAADAVVGADKEKNEPMRVRRELELAAVGGGTVDGIVADVRKLEGVVAAIGSENFTAIDLSAGGGLPPHSFELLVQGGDDDAIAQSIWNNKPAGIRSYGTNADGDATDSQGFPHVVAFTRPTAVTLYAQISKVTQPSGAPTDTDIKEAIRAATQDRSQPGYLAIGATAYGNPLACAAIDLGGLKNVTVTLSKAPGGPFTASVAMAARELPTLDTANMTVL